MPKKRGGRHRLIDTQPQLDVNFQKVLKDHTAGDPMQPDSLWTNLSKEEISRRLEEQATPAGPMGAIVRTARKIVVLIVGVTVLLVGVVMIIAPGPAMVVIPLGLGILATEFVWAARMLKQLQDQNSIVFRYSSQDGKTGEGIALAGFGGQAYNAGCGVGGSTGRGFVRPIIRWLA